MEKNIFDVDVSNGIDERMGVVDEFMKRVVSDGRALALHPEGTIEFSCSLENDVVELVNVLSKACNGDETPDEDTNVIVEELVVFVSKIYRRCSDVVKKQIDGYVESNE